MTEIVSDGQLQSTINQGRCALFSDGQGWKLGKMKDMANARQPEISRSGLGHHSYIVQGLEWSNRSKNGSRKERP